MLSRLGRIAWHRLWEAGTALVRRWQARFSVGVTGVVLDERGHVLLLRHRLRQRRGWDLPGGFVARGEVLTEALIREMREEAGYRIGVDALAGVRIDRGNHVDVLYLAHVVGGQEDLSLAEVVDAAFFPPDNLPAELSLDARREIARALRRDGAPDV